MWFCFVRPGRNGGLYFKSTSFHLSLNGFCWCSVSLVRWKFGFWPAVFLAEVHLKEVVQWSMIPCQNQLLQQFILWPFYPIWVQEFPLFSCLTFYCSFLSGCHISLYCKNWFFFRKLPISDNYLSSREWQIAQFWYFLPIDLATSAKIFSSFCCRSPVRKGMQVCLYS